MTASMSNTAGRIARLARSACIGVVLRHGVASQPTTANDSKLSDADRFFLEEVQPLLASRCVTCHGPDKAEGGLRLDSREAALKGGDSGPALVPGKPDESLLLMAVKAHAQSIEDAAEGQAAFERHRGAGTLDYGRCAVAGGADGECSDSR